MSKRGIRIRRGTVGMLVGAAAALAVAGPAQAACPAQPSSQVFFPWGGDTALYRPVAGSSFEAGAPGWTLTGAAAVVTDHSPWNLQGPNAHSLELPAGASATTPPVCVDSSTPTARLFGVTPVRMPLISGSSLKVEVLYGDPTRGGQSVKALGTLPDELAWDATRKVSLAKGQLNLKPDSTGNTYIRYRFTPLYGTTWRIDDVYVDPRLKY